MAVKDSKWPLNLPTYICWYYTWALQNISKGHHIFQMTITYTKKELFLGPPKYTKLVIFGLQIYHLATLAGGFTQSKWSKWKHRKLEN
jgi:hypothetical protein